MLAVLNLWQLTLLSLSCCQISRPGGCHVGWMTWLHVLDYTGAHSQSVTLSGIWGQSVGMSLQYEVSLWTNLAYLPRLVLDTGSGPKADPMHSICRFRWIEPHCSTWTDTNYWDRKQTNKEPMQLVVSTKQCKYLAQTIQSIYMQWLYWYPRILIQAVTIQH